MIAMRRLSLVLLLWATCAWPAAAQGTNVPWIPIQFLTAAGAPCNGCTLDTWAAGTTTAQATYSDNTLLTANANPVVMNSAGRPTSNGLFLSATSYRFRLRTSAAVTIWDLDNITSVPTASGNTDISGTAGVAIAIGEVVYLSDGSGSLTAGRWYLTDADNTYSSTTAPLIGIATAAIASGATGTIRIAGRFTGLSGLTAGDTNYVSATAGALTATSPTQARCVGRADTTTTLDLPCTVQVPQALNVVEGRCTLTSGTAVTTADVTAATTLYFTPYQGNRIVLYDGSAEWHTLMFTELSLTVPASTNTVYDVFVDFTAGVPALEAVAWTNDTTRATALATQNSVYVQTSDTDSRYVCSFRTTGVSGQTEDSAVKRYVWNYYNRVRRPMRRVDTTDSWTYQTYTYRQARADTANQLDVVVGVAEVMVHADVQVQVANSTVGADLAVGIGEDSTTTNSTAAFRSRAMSYVADSWIIVRAVIDIAPAVGRHYYTWLEISEAVGTTTWIGDNGAAVDGQSGITGWIEG